MGGNEAWRDAVFSCMQHTDKLKYNKDLTPIGDK